MTVMAKFVGIKNNNVCVVSDTPITLKDLMVMEVPVEFQHLSSLELMSGLRLKGDRLTLRRQKKPASQTKLALVGNWKMRCGIATYAENLWPEVIKHVGDFKLFIEHNEAPTGDIRQVGEKLVPDDKVIACWSRGESLQKLVAELKAYDPDVIFIQHEFGLWSNAMHWLSFMNQIQDYHVFVTMHSVFHHKDKTIVEASIQNIIVHLDGAKDVLKLEKEIPGTVTVIPHGCFPCSDREQLWNFYKSEHTFIQWGFGFKYKGWENSINACALLKQEYPDVFFTGLFSESPHNILEHQYYYDELMKLIEALKLQENVAIIRGFQSEKTINSYFRTNKIAVFPYVSHPAHEVFGASGAVRVAMSKGIPVITTEVNHFSDVPTIKANTPEEIAIELKKLFCDKKLQLQQIEKQCEYLHKNTWEKIALCYVKLFENQ